MLSSFLIAVAFFVAKKMGAQIGDQIPLLATVACTTVVWVAATYLSKPTDRETLVKFYRLVRPAGPGWKPVQAEAAVGPSPDSITQSLLGWVMGCCFVYAALFGAGSFLYGRTAQGTMWSVLFVVSGIGLLRLFPKLWSRAPVAPVPDVESAVG
jgi:hypothetical protein